MSWPALHRFTIRLLSTTSSPSRCTAVSTARPSNEQPLRASRRPLNPSTPQNRVHAKAKAKAKTKTKPKSKAKPKTKPKTNRDRGRGQATKRRREADHIRRAVAGREADRIRDIHHDQGRGAANTHRADRDPNPRVAHIRDIHRRRGRDRALLPHRDQDRRQRRSLHPALDLAPDHLRIRAVGADRIRIHSIIHTLVPPICRRRTLNIHANTANQKTHFLLLPLPLPPHLRLRLHHRR
mmetsp:Transcript_11871/g.19115  ORF Transcript_11871/g.19115 Transcript_11871/m.19115 type:complete len:238 (-) Transcript_11871:1021-1734(-)